ncbi:MAG: hypothetical protein IKS67_06910, partial [Victivallales bacterium]|nr:hypothetical protein [Victivallales bacterium]
MTQVQSRFIPKFLAWLKEISGANEPSAKPAEQPKQAAAKAEATETAKATEATETTKATEATETAKAAEAIKVSEAAIAAEA